MFIHPTLILLLTAGADTRNAPTEQLLLLLADASEQLYVSSVPCQDTCCTCDIDNLGG
jgi:hypothetical protein